MDSSQIEDKEPICFVDSHLILGRQSIQIKKSSFFKYQSTQKSKLSCTLDYAIPNQNYDSFVGYVKHFKDPKIEKLSIENFIPRGSIIKHTSWIKGLVVYSGKDTKLIQNSNLKFYKSSFLERNSQIYFCSVCGIAIICALVINNFIIK